MCKPGLERLLEVRRNRAVDPFLGRPQELSRCQQGPLQTQHPLEFVLRPRKLFLSFRDISKRGAPFADATFEGGSLVRKTTGLPTKLIEPLLIRRLLCIEVAGQRSRERVRSGSLRGDLLRDFVNRSAVQQGLQLGPMLTLPLACLRPERTLLLPEDETTDNFIGRRVMANAALLRY